MKSVYSLILILLLSSGCNRPKGYEHRTEVATNTVVILTRNFHSGFLEGSVHTFLAVKWPRAFGLDKIGEVDFGSGTEDIRLITTPAHYVLVYGRSLYHRPIKGGKWVWWLPQNSPILRQPADQSIASYLRDWFSQTGTTNFHYGKDGPCNQEQITFRLPDHAASFTVADGPGGALRWEHMLYKVLSVDEQSNTVVYSTDRTTLPRLLVFTGPVDWFGAWSFDGKETMKRNGSPNKPSEATP